MKIIIAGSRDAPGDIESLIIEGMPPEWRKAITEVVSGHSGNVDLTGERWASRNNIPVRLFHADWSLGRKAGPLRNAAMARYADALLLIWNGASRGSRSMLNCATAELIGIKQIVYKAGAT
jgi:hypothetical protein